MQRTYCDHAADTPVRPSSAAAFAAALPAMGNPSSAHGHGQDARRIVEESRDVVAGHLGCAPGDIIFTSGGTEANNLGLKGIIWAAPTARRHVVTTEVEHAAVLAPLRWLETRGEIELTVVGCEADGRVAPSAVLEQVRDDTVLVSVMAVNNVIGSVNDVASVGAALADGPTHFHVDAVQAMHVALDLGAWGTDAAALSPHKFGGPVGAGVCQLRRGVPVQPLLHGGGQDRGVRSGTLSAALAAATAAAMSDAVAERDGEVTRLAALSDVVRAAVSGLSGVQVIGPIDPAHRLPGTVALAIEGLAADALVFALDRAGLSASVGPACSSGAASANPVLEAMGLSADAGLRVSFGWSSTTADARRAADVLVATLAGLLAESREVG
jgi:cysteine desulfurase